MNIYERIKVDIILIIIPICFCLKKSAQILILCPVLDQSLCYRCNLNRKLLHCRDSFVFSLQSESQVFHCRNNLFSESFIYVSLYVFVEVYCFFSN